MRISLQAICRSTAQLMDIVRQAGGTVRPHPQGLLAIFGVPMTYEDDATAGT